MAVKQGTTNEVTRKIGRSKFATDIMYRLWDSYNSCWISSNSKSIWSTKALAEKVLAGLIKAGRDQDTISIERVFVELSK